MNAPANTESRIKRPASLNEMDQEAARRTVRHLFPEARPQESKPARFNSSL